MFSMFFSEIVYIWVGYSSSYIEGSDWWIVVFLNATIGTIKNVAMLVLCMQFIYCKINEYAFLMIKSKNVFKNPYTTEPS